MRVFVTGASGFIGQAVVRDLLDNNHQVLALARTDESAQSLATAGAEPLRGDIEDLASLKRGAQAADGVIHLAFIHDFSNLAHSLAVDQAAITAMGEAMAGTGKPLVIASGTMMLKKGIVVAEDGEIEGGTVFAARARSADLVYELAREKGVRGMVMRLSPTVHGKGDKGFCSMFITWAKEKGAAIYVGDGSSRWCAVHRVDAAALFRLAIEKGTAGANYHAVAEEGVPIKDIMGLIGKKLELPVKGKSLEEAAGDFGIFAQILGADNKVSSEKTKKELGWKPVQKGLLEDMEENYFV